MRIRCFLAFPGRAASRTCSQSFHPLRRAASPSSGGGGARKRRTLLVIHTCPRDQESTGRWATEAAASATQPLPPPSILIL
jgi:hypothetical protein